MNRPQSANVDCGFYMPEGQLVFTNYLDCLIARRYISIAKIWIQAGVIQW